MDAKKREAFLQAEKDIKKALEKEHKQYIKPTLKSRKQKIDDLMSIDDNLVGEDIDTLFES